MKTAITFLKESVNELKLVTWLKQEELLRKTILVVIFVLISSILLGVLDFGLTLGYQKVLNLGA
ncbi:MAG: preprotein translocase subunit SecE [Candidatus Gracilibacteria bacterium]|nr:preprotein translocase subunit SecE [bacterium]MDZ4217104.1 preprotein translocase subunit SecE [Candidatus Gracilibacteria bacterium]